MKTSKRTILDSLRLQSFFLRRVHQRHSCRNYCCTPQVAVAETFPLSLCPFSPLRDPYLFARLSVLVRMMFEIRKNQLHHYLYLSQPTPAVVAKQSTHQNHHTYLQRSTASPSHFFLFVQKSQDPLSSRSGTAAVWRVVSAPATPAAVGQLLLPY